MDKFELRGTKENPYHLSVGIVALRDNKIAIVHVGGGKLSELHTTVWQGGNFTLPRETMWTDESLEATAKRGCIEEVGYEGEITRYLGSLYVTFQHKTGTNIQKTTLYFLVAAEKETVAKREQHETDDKILWVEQNAAIKLLEENENEEYKIVQRINNV